MEWLLTVATGTALLVLFALSELALHYGIPAEITRRLAHVVGAGTAATFPLYLQLRDVLVLALVFTAFLSYTWMRRSLHSIHAIERPSLGAPLFPLGLGLAAVAVWGHPGALAFGALVLAFADPAAATIGRWRPSPTWRVVGGPKSVNGSVAVFVVSVLLATMFGLSPGWLSPVRVGAIATILTLCEGSLGLGLDNLVLPVTSAVAGEVLLGL